MGEIFRHRGVFARERHRSRQAARDVGANGYFALGFDIASALYGDPALGAQGITEPVPGPGQTRIRDGLNDPGKRGFDASKKLHLGPPALERRAYSMITDTLQLSERSSRWMYIHVLL